MKFQLLVEKLLVAQVVKEMPIFRGNRSFITVLTFKPPHDRFLGQISSYHIMKPRFLQDPF
jgi:hypothetical protein